MQANIIKETKTVDYVDNGEEQQSNQSGDDIQIQRSKLLGRIHRKEAGSAIGEGEDQIIERFKNKRVKRPGEGAGEDNGEHENLEQEQIQPQLEYEFNADIEGFADFTEENQDELEKEDIINDEEIITDNPERPDPS